MVIDQKAILEDIVTERTEKLKATLNNGTVQDWNGTISNILISEGKGAFLEVELPCGAFLEPQDNLIKRARLLVHQKNKTIGFCMERCEELGVSPS